MDDTKEWNVPTSTNRLLCLPHNILLQIFDLLPKKTVYEACLVHNKLVPEAKSVLWEAPCFQSGSSANQFVRTVLSTRRLALMVQSLYLCVLTTEDPMFPIVNKSSLTIHQQQDTNTMSDPKLILFLTKQCEKITSLTIYSDKIESSHIEQVAATAIHLTSLCLIGSKKKDVPYINGLLSRIQSLTLDGPFIITELWATQMKRATHLTSLQISLLGMEIFVLEKLCRNIPQLTQLTLTDASSFTDRDVEIVTGFFPKLQSFVLQGSDHITEVALFHALSSCAQLQELKLRASISRREHPHQSLGRYGIPPDHIVIYLQTLVLENMMMDDDWFLVMSAKLKHLKNVGFKACPNLTDRAVAALLKQCKNITDLHVSECPRVSLRAFTTNTASLRRISLEHSGPSALADIHQLCITAKLFMLRVSATPQLEKSFLAEKINANNLLELNKQDMVDMANNTHPEHALTTSEDIVLTEHHVFQLAERLNVSLDVLTNILDDITGRKEIFAGNSASLDYSGYSNVTDSTGYKEEEEEEEEEDTNQSSQTKSSDNSFISQDWHNDYDEKAISETDGVYSEDDDIMYNQLTTSKDGFSTMPDWAPDQHDDGIPTLANWQSQIHNNDITNGNADEWPLPGQQKPPTSKSAASPENAWANTPDTIRTSNTRMSRQTNVHSVWNPEVAEAEVRQLTGTAMSGQMSRAKQLGHGRTQSRIADEGWGNVPDKYVAWSDVSRHGYNAEVLDKQRNTVYWRKENGNWKQCDQGLAETSTYAGEAPPTSSPSRAFSRARADSYQSSTDSYTEDHTRNKLPRDPDASKYTKNPRNNRKLRDKLPPQKMTGDWGMFFGHETPSPDQTSKPPSPQQADASLVDIIDEFSPNRMNVHQNIHQPVANQWNQNNDLANIFDNNTNDPKKVMEFTNLLELEENGSAISDNSRPNINNSTNSISNINNSANSSSSSSINSDISRTNFINSDNSSSNINSDNSSNSTTSPNLNDTTIPTIRAQAVATTTTTTTTTTITTNNSNNHTPVSTPSPFSSPAPPSELFTTKIKLKIIPTKTDTLYINKENVRDQIAGLLAQYNMHDEEKFEKMVTDATSYLVKKQTDSVFNVKKKSKIV